MKSKLRFVIIFIVFGLFIFSCKKDKPEIYNYKVQFSVRSGGIPIQGATVKIGETNSMFTNMSGVCSVELPNGVYSYSITSIGFEKQAPTEFKVDGNDLYIEVSMDTTHYTVTFDTDGGSIINAQIVAHGATSVKPEKDPEKANCSFKGWFVNDKEFNFSTPITNDTTIKAKWAKIYTVVFMVNETTVIDFKKVVEGNLVEVPTENPSMVGYAFNGWYVDGKKYDFSTPITSDLKIMANWLKLFKVSFNTDGGSEIASQMIADGDTIRASKIHTTKKGFSLEGWYLDGLKYNMTTPIVKDITLSAKWGYAVIFKSGTEDVVSFVVPPSNTVIIPSNPINNYSTFVRWFTRGESVGTEEFTANSIIDSDTTVYAEWVMHDIDNNSYKAVTIGSQVWMAENLRTTKYNNGTPITLVEDNSVWAGLSTGAYCYYNNNLNNEANIYGALYNSYAVRTQNLCPSGWHEPSVGLFPGQPDWPRLRDYLKSAFGSEPGKYLKSVTGWQIYSGIGNTNVTGFTALPGGYRSSDGSFNFEGRYGYWWCVDYDYNSNQGVFFNSLHYDNYWLNQILMPAKDGLSIRCVRD